MPIKLHRATDLTTEDTAAIRTLSAAVYPPETVATWPGRSIEWASADWRVVCWDEFGQAMSHVGVVLRDGRVDDNPVKIGGVGGVMTHPDKRCQGLAANGIARAIEFFSEQAADFALLVCEADLVPIYERLGWRRFSDPLVVTQFGEKRQFTFNLPMIHAVCTDGPRSGVIDLMGPPW